MVTLEAHEHTATRYIPTQHAVLSKLLELELCADELVVGGGVGWSYDRRRRRRRCQTGRESTGTAHSLDRRFFSGFTGVIHFTCDLCAEKITVNMHAVHNFTVMSFWRLIQMQC